MSKQRDDTWNRLPEQHIACPVYAPDEKTVLDAIDPREFYKVDLPDLPAPASGEWWVDGGPCPFCEESETTEASIPDERTGNNLRLDLKTGAFCCFDCLIRGKDILDFVVNRDQEFFRRQSPGSESGKRKYASLWLAETWEV